MNREALVRELRKLARKDGVAFEVVSDRGKGAHSKVRYGDKWTIIQSGELKPGHVRTIYKQLGIG